MDINVYFSPKDREYYSTERIPCDFCKKISDIIILGTFTSKNHHSRHFYCSKCVHEVPENPYLIKTLRPILFITQLPKDAQPFIENGTDIGYGKMGLTVFDVADKQIDNESVIDRTVYAGRNSINGAIVGNPDMKLIEEKDLYLLPNEANIKLFEISESTIEHKEQKKIGGKK